MDWKYMVLLLLKIENFYQLTINANDSSGFVGGNVSLKWNITVDVINGKIYELNVYTKNRSNLISDLDSGLTNVAKEIFGKRISRTWMKDPPNFYQEITIEKLSYTDSQKFEIEIVDNTHKISSSIINLIVKGGVETCGNKIQHTFTYGDSISESFHLCGNPQPKVSIAIGDKQPRLFLGSLVNETTRKYRYEVKVPFQSFKCEKSIKYHFTGYKSEQHDIKLIPKKVQEVQYKYYVSSKCTDISWKPLDDGKCPILKYQLIFQNVAETVTTNKSSFKYCKHAKQPASYVRVIALYNDVSGESSNMTHIHYYLEKDVTQPPYTTDANSPPSSVPKDGTNLLIIIIPTVAVAVILLIIIVCCCWLCKNNGIYVRLMTLKTSRARKESNISSPDKHMKIIDDTNKVRLSDISPNSPYINNEKLKFLNRQYSPTASVISPITTPVHLSINSTPNGYQPVAVYTGVGGGEGEVDDVEKYNHFPYGINRMSTESNWSPAINN